MGVISGGGGFLVAGVMDAGGGVRVVAAGVISVRNGAQEEEVTPEPLADYWEPTGSERGRPGGVFHSADRWTTCSTTGRTTDSTTGGTTHSTTGETTCSTAGKATCTIGRTICSTTGGTIYAIRWTISVMGGTICNNAKETTCNAGEVTNTTRAAAQTT